MRFVHTFAAALAVATFSLPAAAQGFRPVFGASLTGGGETLVTVQYTNGSSQNIKSGGLFQVFGGVEYVGTSAAVQATIGYHVDDTTANNGSVKFARMPAELLGFWKLNDTIWLGGGVRKANNAKVSSSGAASNLGSVKFGSKVGAVVQGEYFFSPNGSAFLRYVAEDYTVGNASLSGNHVGLGASLRF